MISFHSSIPQLRPYVAHKATLSNRNERIDCLIKLKRTKYKSNHLIDNVVDSSFTMVELLPCKRYINLWNWPPVCGKSIFKNKIDRQTKNFSCRFRYRYFCAIKLNSAGWILKHFFNSTTVYCWFNRRWPTCYNHRQKPKDHTLRFAANPNDE